MARPIPFRRSRRPRLAELRSMIWLGLILGLLAFQALRLWPAPIEAPVKPPIAQAPAPPSPWAESERSRAILSGQEGAPIGTPPAGGSPRPTRASFASVRVIDGDTFDQDGVRIRIANIDTPETHPARCAAEAALGERATRRLEALLAAGPFALVPIGRDEDRFGRKLRRVVRGGSDLGEVLVSEGLARPYAGGRRAGWCG